MHLKKTLKFVLTEQCMHMLSPLQQQNYDLPVCIRMHIHAWVHKTHMCVNQTTTSVPLCTCYMGALFDSVFGRGSVADLELT